MLTAAQEEEQRQVAIRRSVFALEGRNPAIRHQTKGLLPDAALVAAIYASGRLMPADRQLRDDRTNRITHTDDEWLKDAISGWTEKHHDAMAHALGVNAALRDTCNVHGAKTVRSAPAPQSALTDDGRKSLDVVAATMAGQRQRNLREQEELAALAELEADPDYGEF